MGRKRKYNTAMEIENAFRAPEGEETEPARKRRIRSKNAALSRLRKREGVDPGRVTGMENGELGTATTVNGDVRETDMENNGNIAVVDAVVRWNEPSGRLNDSIQRRQPRPRRRADMSASQLEEVRRKDRERKAAKRRNENAQRLHRQREQERRQRLTQEERLSEQSRNSAARSLQRLELTDNERSAIQERDTAARSSQRQGMSEDERRVIQERDTAARSSQRQGMSEDERSAIRERDTAARSSQRQELNQEAREELQVRDTASRGAARERMPHDERLLQREAQRFRNRSRKYKKGYANHEDFVSSIIRGRDTLHRRHYFSRFLSGHDGDERVCPHCKAWKFPGETDNCCCKGGKVDLPPRREAPRKLRLLFDNPAFMKSIRAYNNVFAFTSMGASTSESLHVDESVTRRGVYNFRVMGTVCHRMGSLLPPSGGNPMFAQIYINDPDSATRVLSRIRMTDGLSEEFVSDIDAVMEEHNPYAQQFLHAREILIERSRPALEAARAERARRREEEGKQEEDMHEPLIDPDIDCVLRLHVDRGTNPGTHNTPTTSEVAAIIIDANASEPRDIVLYTRQGGFNRIYETNSSYDPLQYPLLHPYGEKGWTYKMAYAGVNQNRDEDVEAEVGRRGRGGRQDQNMEEELDEWGYVVQFEDGTEERRKTTMSLREFVAYLLYDRTGSHSLLLLGGRLTQQYCVDQWAKAEQERLRYIENNQLEFRLESIQGLTDAYRHEGTEDQRGAEINELLQVAANPAVNRRRQNESGDAAEVDAGDVGRRLILPPSFTGGPRYMYQRFQDAMAIVRELGAPNLFITMTCNPKWAEIKENIRPGQTASDRPDIVARVFMRKLKSLCKDLDEGILGIQTARIHVVEYQKRGLPHAHILMILRPEDKPITAEDIDRLVSAELPDPDENPDLYETVLSCMMHGPCGDQNKTCPCMKNGKCSKKFPKPFAEATTMAVDKYPVYRRRQREAGNLHRGDKVWDNATINQWIVPYNPYLSQKYNCHINVEVCATNRAIKYIYKYVYKGADMTTITIEGQVEEQPLNEILQYLLARYISPVEACMRLFRHPTQGSTHNVVKLAVHLPGQSSAVYRQTIRFAG